MTPVWWAPVRREVLTLAHMLNGTCRCGRANGRGKRVCCHYCSGGSHSKLCRLRNEP